MNNFNTTFAIALISTFTLITAGCASESNDAEAPRATIADVEEINAERGNPCDCVDSKLGATEDFLTRAKAAEFATVNELNVAFAEILKGCMEPIGHKEADFVWSQKMMECANFNSIREAMISIQTVSRDIKLQEQEDFTDGRPASEVLDKLQETH